MAVSVDKGFTSGKNYPSGDRVIVDDGGHLLVQKLDDGKWVNVAIHAPTKWSRAEVSQGD